MRILFTNNGFNFRAGTELFCRDMALALKHRGHEVVLYSDQLGKSARNFQQLSLQVIDDLGKLSWEPDLIHAQHHLVAMTALLRFPHVPAIMMCHGATLWLEEPVNFPSIRRYVAVDDPTHERLQAAGLPVENIRILRTAVDLNRFPVRQIWLEKPRKVLAFSSYLGHDENLRILRDACQKAGFGKLDIISEGLGKGQTAPETILPLYDIIFAKGRSAHEAAATGAAVIVTDTKKLAGLLTPKNYDAWRPLNLGFKTMQHPLTVNGIIAALQNYDAKATQEVTTRIRSEANLEDAVDRLIGIYEEARAECSALENTPVSEFSMAAASYQRRLSIHIQSHDLSKPAELFLKRVWCRFRVWWQNRKRS